MLQDILYKAYKEDKDKYHFQNDPAQERALEILGKVGDELILKQQLLIKRKWFFFKKKPVCGVYLWGAVGRGKTYVMDLFYQHLPVNDKRRLHFHEFMIDVHQQLHKLRGHKNPMQQIAKSWAQQTSVLCFDEFAVFDVADAMILAQLLIALHDEQLTLIATSNQQPVDLYQGGVQRDLFLPAIAWLQQHTHIVAVNGASDYRQHNSGFSTHAESMASLHELCHQLGLHKTEQEMLLAINKRQIKAQSFNNNAVWFTFAQICRTQRNASDYLQLAERFPIWVITNASTLSDDDISAVRRFIQLIDVLYDKKIKLWAENTLLKSNLYTGRQVAFEFARTRSRLQEMLA